MWLAGTGWSRFRGALCRPSGGLFRAAMPLAVCLIMAGCSSGGDDDGGGFIDFPPIPILPEPSGTVAFQVEAGQSEFTLSIAGLILASDVVVSGNDASLNVLAHPFDGSESAIDYPFPDGLGIEHHDVAVTWGADCLALIVDGQTVASTTYESVIGPPDSTNVGGESSVSALKVFSRRMDADEIEIVQNGGPATLAVDTRFVGTGQVERSVCIELGSGDVRVATTEHDLVWDSTCAMLVGGSCRTFVGSNTSLTISPVDESTLRVVANSRSNAESVPNRGLYCCSFLAVLKESGGCCLVAVQNATAVDPNGKKIAIGEVNGGICNVDPIPTACD